jgi:protein SCO1/2
MVKLLSISTSPDTDSLPVLQFWSNKYGGDASKWIFARGPIDKVWEIGLGAFSMKEFMDKTRNRIPFTARAIALVDKEGRVRKYYEGTNDFGIEKQLFEDLRALLTLEYKEDFGQ